MSNDDDHGPDCSRTNRCRECIAQVEAFQSILPRWSVLGGNLYHSHADLDDDELARRENEYAGVVSEAYDAGIAHILLWVAATVTAMDALPNVSILRTTGDHPQWKNLVETVTTVYRHAHDGDGEKGQDAIVEMDHCAGGKGRLYLHCYFAAGLMHVMAQDCTPHQRAAFMLMAGGDIPDVTIARPASVYLAARIAGAYAEGSDCADGVITRVVMEDLTAEIIYTLATAMAQHYREAAGLLGVSQDGEVTPVSGDMVSSTDLRLRGAAVAANLARDIAIGDPDTSVNLRAGIGNEKGVVTAMLATLGASYGQAVLRFMAELPEPEGVQ